MAGRLRKATPQTPDPGRRETFGSRLSEITIPHRPLRPTYDELRRGVRRDRAGTGRRRAMAEKSETKAVEMARLEKELDELRKTLPEHCHGTKGCVGVHRASVRHWEQIEQIEERIR